MEDLCKVKEQEKANIQEQWQEDWLIQLSVALYQAQSIGKGWGGSASLWLSKSWWQGEVGSATNNTPIACKREITNNATYTPENVLYRR